MTSKLFCRSCEKSYQVDSKNIQIVEESKNPYLQFSHDIYYYEKEGGCFFKTLNQIKSKLKEQ